MTDEVVNLSDCQTAVRAVLKRHSDQCQKRVIVGFSVRLSLLPALLTVSTRRGFDFYRFMNVFRVRCRRRRGRKYGRRGRKYGRRGRKYGRRGRKYGRRGRKYGRRGRKYGRRGRKYGRRGRKYGRRGRKYGRRSG